MKLLLNLVGKNKAQFIEAMEDLVQEMKDGRINTNCSGQTKLGARYSFCFTNCNDEYCDCDSEQSKPCRVPPFKQILKFFEKE